MVSQSFLNWKSVIAFSPDSLLIFSDTLVCASKQRHQTRRQQIIIVDQRTLSVEEVRNLLMCHKDLNHDKMLSQTIVFQAEAYTTSLSLMFEQNLASQVLTNSFPHKR